MKSQLSSLVDTFDRRIRYLRLSVTDRCDFRCQYCMTEDMRFLPRKAVLSEDELVRLASLFVELGVEKIRLTGGEPLIRPDIVSIARRLHAIEGLKELVLTTNGSQLTHLANRSWMRVYRASMLASTLFVQRNSPNCREPAV